MEDYTTYTAHAIINIWDTDIKIDIPFLEEKCEYLDLREIILEYETYHKKIAFDFAKEVSQDTNTKYYVFEKIES